MQIKNIKKTLIVIAIGVCTTILGFFFSARFDKTQVCESFTTSNNSIVLNNDKLSLSISENGNEIESIEMQDHFQSGNISKKMVLNHHIKLDQNITNWALVQKNKNFIIYSYENLIKMIKVQDRTVNISYFSIKDENLSYKQTISLKYQDKLIVSSNEIKSTTLKPSNKEIRDVLGNSNYIGLIDDLKHVCTFLQKTKTSDKISSLIVGNCFITKENNDTFITPTIYECNNLSISILPSNQKILDEFNFTKQSSGIFSVFSNILLKFLNLLCEKTSGLYGFLLFSFLIGLSFLPIMIIERMYKKSIIGFLLAFVKMFIWIKITNDILPNCFHLYNVKFLWINDISNPEKISLLPFTFLPKIGLFSVFTVIQIYLSSEKIQINKNILAAAMVFLLVIASRSAVSSIIFTNISFISQNLNTFILNKIFPEKTQNQ